MVDTFTFKTQTVGDGKYGYNNRKAKYGDGYVQTVGNGINTETQSWPLTFVGPRATMDAIITFLRSHKGVASFLWYNPLGELGLYTFDDFTVTPLSFKNVRITVTFNLTYTP